MQQESLAMHMSLADTAYLALEATRQGLVGQPGMHIISQS